MKSLLAVALLILWLSSSLNALEYSNQSTSNRSKRTAAKTTPKRTKGRTRRSTLKTARRPVVKPSLPPWEEFTSSEGRFSVLMPKIPTDKTDVVDTEQGPYTTHLYVARDETSRVFLVGWVDYNPEFHFNRQSEMEANRDNFVKGVGAKLLTSRSVMVDGHRTLEFTAENDEKSYKSRVYVVGRRPYQIVIGWPKGQDNSENVNRFFNSFKVNLN